MSTNTLLRIMGIFGMVGALLVTGSCKSDDTDQKQPPEAQVEEPVPVAVWLKAYRYEIERPDKAATATGQEAAAAEKTGETTAQEDTTSNREAETQARREQQRSTSGQSGGDSMQRQRHGEHGSKDESTAAGSGDKDQKSASGAAAATDREADILAYSTIADGTDRDAIVAAVIEAQDKSPLLAEERLRTSGTPTLDPAERIGGDSKIELSREAKSIMAKRNIEEAEVSARVCVSAEGVPMYVKILDSSEIEAVDERVRAQMMEWRYRPQRVQGDPIPFCERVAFRYELDNVGRAKPVL